ncbi:tetratricopeptide repeat protein [Solwaraspora sp. WMMD1047]|uniref:tetratricopeptide repeat protein n=1 Tax=Solwaraspora sp. WMMD1047 TaxID=3016102 RepID=UPI0024167545|nr:tetratricopeptide repeat protein [Solwaraspora sp. WMMD1047]MDG4832560.1 tetratricopeptide repeat protein [Solwaraspora sp. WMMD1047]
MTDLLAAARLAGSRGDHEEQTRLSAEAVEVCRMLVGRHPDDPRHVSALAAGLYNHAYRLIHLERPAQAREVLDEAQRHYTTLATADPHRYAVALCDVTLRMAVVLVQEGSYDEAAQAGRDALDGYQEVTEGDSLEREFGLVRSHALIGRALLLDGRPDQALSEFDTALFAAERLREEAGTAGTDFFWLSTAPPSFRLAAPEWLGAAVGAMELHDAAGAWGIAADAANIAMRVAGSLAAIGNSTDRLRFEAISARAQQIWWAAEHPVEAAARRAGPTGEVLVGGGGIVLGPRRQPDIAAISMLAGWGRPPR